MEDISNITLKKHVNKQLSFALFDQNDEVIYIHEANIQVADSSILDYRLISATSVELRPLAAGATTVTFTAKGVNKVLNVTVVDVVPTAVKVYEGEVSFINRKVYD